MNYTPLVESIRAATTEPVGCIMVLVLLAAIACIGIGLTAAVCKFAVFAFTWAFA